MNGELEDIFGMNEVVPITKTVQGVKLPELQIEDEFFPFEKAKNGSKHSAQIQREAFRDDIVGDCPSDVLERAAEVTEQQVEALLKSGGHAGKKLARLYKTSMSLEESMRALFSANEELFDLDGQKLIEKAIAACDVAAFLTLFNQAIGVA